MAFRTGNTKLIRFIAALLFSALIGSIAYNLAMKKAIDEKNERKYVNPKSDLNVTSAPATTFDANGITSSHSAPERSSQEIAVVDSWFKQVGFSTEAQRSYDLQYSDEQLKALADAGDTIAIDALTARYIARGQSELVAPLSEKGIIYGSFNSIQAMMYRYASILNPDDSVEIRQRNKENLKQYFSYVGLMRIRGVDDMYATHIDEKTQLNYFKEKYNETDPLTPEDYKWIEEHTRELYDHYQAERHKLGLGDFDNTRPKEVQEFFAR